MLHRPIAWLVLVLVVSTWAQAGLPDPFEDDAGSGQDAPGTPRTALRLPGPGKYEGTLSPPDDADWYALDLPYATSGCMRLQAEGAAYAKATLALTPDLALAVAQPLAPAFPVDLGIANPSIPRTYVGFEPMEGTPLAPSEPFSFGKVEFEVSLLDANDLPPGDAGTGEDAGDTRDTAARVPAPCFGGTLDPDADDLLDLFTFEAEEGDVVTLSFALGASTKTVLTLLSPDGAQVAQLRSGDAVETTLNATGEWVLEARQYSPLESSYVVGVSMMRKGPPEPEEEPCRPTCMLT